MLRLLRELGVYERRTPPRIITQITGRYYDELASAKKAKKEAAASAKNDRSNVYS
jgi:hypothetical protein